MKLAYREELTQETLRGHLSYDPETGDFFWLKRGRGRQAGRPAGSRTQVYPRIKIGFQTFLSHRLAWFYVYGEWPEEIDHINGDPRDNRLCNLRACTRAQNSRNQRATSRSKSGVRGVSKKFRRWQVQITHDGMERYVGSYETLEEARSAYYAAAIELHGEFARSE